MAGTVVFSGSLYALVLTGVKALGAVTPVGGLLFLAGWGALAWGALRGDPVWGAAAADVARAERSGLCLADLLRLHADDARRVAADRATLAARTVGVRSVVPLMVCFLPAFILVGVVPIVAGLVADFMG